MELFKPKHNRDAFITSSEYKGTASLTCPTEFLSISKQSMAFNPNAYCIHSLHFFQKSIDQRLNKLIQLNIICVISKTMKIHTKKKKEPTK